MSSSSVDGPVAPAAPVGLFEVLDGGGLEDYFAKAFVQTAGDTSISKLHVKRVIGRGVGSMQKYPPSVENTGLSRITDCIAEDVKHDKPGAAGGRSEANFWFGNKTHASRLRGVRSGWMGMFTGSKCYNSIIEDFLLEEHAVGVYIEHVTRDTVFKRFKIDKICDKVVAGGVEPGGILRARSISIEYWYNKQGSYNLIFEDGEICCPAPSGPDDEVRAGVYVGPGTYGLTFRRCRFFGPGVALRLPCQRQGHPDAVIDNCWFEQAGEKIVHHNHKMGE